ncbi:hypothetical protein D046_3894A, partial [Vibrio parahaemolyticus V-223/04]
MLDVERRVLAIFGSIH